jgi:hypothetical protein
MLRETARVTALAATLLGLPEMACDVLAQAGAETIATRVVVRVIGRDSKIIGSGVGGAQVSIVDARTGETLAAGKQEGGTGDTDRIISTPHARGTATYDTEDAAGFTAELHLTEPTIVNISAIGPLGHPQAIRSATKQVLLVPGRHVEGDGIVLELHGFIVEILVPEPLTPVASAFDVTARVRMMCGCVIEPGGLWDANEKEFVARLKENGRVVSTSRLEYAGETSMFRGTVSVPEGGRPGDLELEVVVSDAAKQNFGRHAIPLSRGG